MTKKPLCIAILWHMHQPDYGDIQTGEIYLPWTRFHATKDYYDMGALVIQHPGLHLTINIVPSLLDQLEAYGSGKARETYAILTAKDASQLDGREKVFLLRAFFQLPYKQMLFPYPRYKHLLEKRGPADEHGEYPSGLEAYTGRDYRDLQVWFNLSWCGRWLRQNPDIAELLRKGKSFAESDKKLLLRVQNELTGGIIPLYRRLMEENGIEISVSPYYHPIIPLLCDSRVAREALPNLALPESPFSFPEDAREHIRRARLRYREFFGRDVAGMWPSEGAISDQTAMLSREEGLRWLASDDGVLLNSLKKLGRTGDNVSLGQRYLAYDLGNDSAGPSIFFRDHELSDLIGFTYSGWPAEDAANDFLKRLSAIHQNLPDDGKHYVVPIILDGENAWEYYPDNGAAFLGLLYRGLTASGQLKTVTFSEYLDLEPNRERLPAIVAGSWIYGNLATWMGHPEKNRAWELLAAARGFINQQRQAAGESAQMRAAYKEMMVSEGSDWFWWFGDDHQTQNAAEFDMLFRKHLRNVYRLLDQSYPQELDLPIKKTELKAQSRNPVHTLTPRLDGKVSDYFEWLSAGHAAPARGESMHRSDPCLEKLYFGYDAMSFYLRIDLAHTKRGLVSVDTNLVVHFVAPREIVLSLEVQQDHRWRCRTLQSPLADLKPDFAAGNILELGIPLSALGIVKPDEVRFFVSAQENSREVERLPASGFLAVSVDPWGLDQQEWMV